MSAFWVAGRKEFVSDSAGTIRPVLARLTAWVRELRRPPTAEELEAKKEADEILDERDTYRVLARGGPDFSTDSGRERRD